MRYQVSEKLEIIKLLEQSHLSAKQALARLGVPRRTFYRWYDSFLEGRPEALADRTSNIRACNTASSPLNINPPHESSTPLIYAAICAKRAYDGPSLSLQI